MKKKIYLLFALSLCIALLIPSFAFAEESANTKRVFTPELATEFAQDFVDSTYPSEKITAHNPTIVFDENAQPIGYIVEFNKDGKPNGYIIYDTTNPSLLSEFVVDSGIVNPFINNENLNALTAETFSSDETAVVKTQPYSYTAVNLETESTVTNYGEDAPLEKDLIDELTEKNADFLSRSNNPVTWDDIFVIIDTGKYSIASSKIVTPFLGRNRDTDTIREAAEGRYACAVVALIDCAEYYDPNFHSQSLSSTYDAISNATNTEYDSTGQGSTSNASMGSGFTSYMSNRGIQLSYSSKANPTWNDYYSSVNSWNMSTFNCHLPNQGLGHAMSVQGYMILDPLPTGNIVYTLCVHDGWTTAARYVNFNFSEYTRKYGVFFS